MLDCIAGCHGFYSHARPVLKGESTACCPANVDHDAACNDDGGRISSVGKALDCRAEGPRLYSHAEPILRVDPGMCVDSGKCLFECAFFRDFECETFGWLG